MGSFKFRTSMIRDIGVRRSVGLKGGRESLFVRGCGGAVQGLNRFKIGIVYCGFVPIFS